MIKRIVRWMIVYLIGVAIFYFSSLSYPLGKDAGMGISSWILHFVEYSLLSASVYFAFSKENIFKNKWLSTFLFVLMFAITDEVHQMFVAGRQASFFDIGIDVASGFLVAMFAGII